MIKGRRQASQNFIHISLLPVGSQKTPASKTWMMVGQVIMTMKMGKPMRKRQC